MLTTETQEWFTQLAKHNEQQMEMAVKEMEAATQKRAEEQIKIKELEQKLEIQ